MERFVNPAIANLPIANGEWPSINLLVADISGPRPAPRPLDGKTNPLAHPHGVESATPQALGHEEPVHSAVVDDEAVAMIRLETRDASVRHVHEPPNARLNRSMNPAADASSPVAGLSVSTSPPIRLAHSGSAVSVISAAPR